MECVIIQHVDLNLPLIPWRLAEARVKFHGQTYPISLSQGYGGTAYDEYFSVWIDYDQSGTFDASELAYSVGPTNSAPNRIRIIATDTLLFFVLLHFQYF